MPTIKSCGQVASGECGAHTRPRLVASIGWEQAGAGSKCNKIASTHIDT